MWASWAAVTTVALRAVKGTRRPRCVAWVKTGRIRMSWRLGSERAAESSQEYGVRVTGQNGGYITSTSVIPLITKAKRGDCEEKRGVRARIAARLQQSQVQGLDHWTRRQMRCGYILKQGDAVWLPWNM